MKSYSSELTMKF